jgi:hypothetical protein
MAQLCNPFRNTAGGRKDKQDIQVIFARLLSSTVRPNWGRDQAAFPARLRSSPLTQSSIAVLATGIGFRHSDRAGPYGQCVGIGQGYTEAEYDVFGCPYSLLDAALGQGSCVCVVIELGDEAGVTVRLDTLLEVAGDLVDRAKVGLTVVDLEAIDG